MPIESIETAALELRAEETESGIHILADLHVTNTDNILTYAPFNDFLLQSVQDLGLHTLGHLFYDFQPSGFTGVVCLSESHVSIHTFPEKKYLTIDIYLSNHTMDNSPKGRKLFKAIHHFFSPVKLTYKEIAR